MDSAEMTEWIAYDRLEPFGARRASADAGMIAAAIGNFSGFRPEGQIYKPSDFMVDYLGKSAPDEVSEADNAEALQSINEVSLRSFLEALADNQAGTVKDGDDS
jgi:hypothetical protein